MSSRGEDGWHALHSEHFGEDRWATLHLALHRDVEHLCLLNPFLSAEDSAAVAREYKLRPTSLPGAYTFEVPDAPQEQYRVCLEGHEEGAIFLEPDPRQAAPTPGAQTSGAAKPAPFLLIDGAALLPALALAVEPEEHVLDLCAAPGGKAMVLASAMFAGRTGVGDAEKIRGRLVLNEAAKARASRMQRAATDFLPASLLDSGFSRGARVIFTSADACTSHNTAERHGPYDKILVDAPCTEDRLDCRAGDAGKLQAWSAARPRVASEKQLKMLFNALWWLKPGGVLVYCCRALAREECDGIVERLLGKARGIFELEVLPLEEYLCRAVPGLAAENTDWGTRILPDKSPFGPIYFSRMRLVRILHDAAPPRSLGA